MICKCRDRGDAAIKKGSSIIAAIFHKLLKKTQCGWGERSSVCDHLDMISNVLRALRTIQQTLNSIYTDILSSSR